VSALVRRARRKNARETALIVLALIALTALVGFVLFGTTGMAYAVAFGLGLVALGPTVPTRWVVRASGARRLAPWEGPELHRTVQELAERAGLPRPPTVLLHPSGAPNAFTVGDPTDAAVVVSAGLLRRLDDRELQGVLAHEIAHVQHRDIAVMRLASTLGNLTAVLSRFGVLLALVALPLAMLGTVVVPWTALPTLWAAPLAANALLLALSRRRELDADLGAVELTRDPPGLARALLRLDASQGTLLERLLGVRRENVPEWMRTHPSTEARIAQLRSL